MSMARVLVCLFGLWFASGVVAGTHTPRPVISIIIDDLGYSLSQAREVMAISPGITLSVLPFAPYSRKVSALARENQREFMLHLPMQGHEHKNLDPGILTLDMSETEFLDTLQENLAAIDGYVGINHHKGSRLTVDATRMRTLMRTLANRGDLFVIDSKTSSASHIGRFGREFGVPTADRNVFLDVERDPEAIRGQFMRLLKLARERGYAIAIGHPYPETVSTLKQLLTSELREEFLLLPVAQQLTQRRQGSRISALGGSTPQIR